MCEKCRRQTKSGTCTNPKSRFFLKLCPGFEHGADIRECDFAEIEPGEIAITTRVIKAPFTEDQVASLNEYQKSTYVHQYTCENDHMGIHFTNDDRILIVDRFGLHCKKCSYFQDWAHKGSTDWSWKITENK